MNRECLNFKVSGQPLEIVVDWPDSVEEAVERYSSAGTLKIIHEGLKKLYRRKLEEEWKKSSAGTWPSLTDRADLVESTVQDWLPPGPIPKSKAELLLEQIQKLPDYERNQLALALTPAQEAAQNALGAEIDLQGGIDPLVNAFASLDSAQRVQFIKAIKEKQG